MNWPGAAQLGDHLEAVLAGQHDIEDYQVEARGAGLESIERGFARVRHVYLVAFRFQVEAQAFGQVLLIFHYEDARHLASGNCRTKVLPRPGPSLSAHTLPLWRLATERTM